MSPGCAIVAWGAVSALGEGRAAFACPPAGEAAGTCVARDAALEAAGLARPFCARAEGLVAPGRDRATLLVERALDACARELDVAMPGWRDARVGLALGTSSGGMGTFEGNDGASLPLEATYLGPVLASSRPRAFAPFSLVLGACASSTIALGLARAWLAEDACDVVLAGGFDAVCVFVASGFEVLRATSAAAGPRPFREGRDGLALGEGAAVLALRRAARGRAFVRGFGASCDAAHLTAPDRTGSGLAACAAQAIASSGVSKDAIALVSAHGTATVFNDDAEAKAIEAALGDRARAATVHAFKGTIGHTLGAAGALETLAAIDAMDRGIAPASHGQGRVPSGLGVLDVSREGGARAALKLASAFGGANAALVVTLDPPASEAAAPAPHAWISRAVHVEAGSAPGARALAERTGYAEDRIARGDGLVRLTLAAVAALEDRVGSLRSAGIVVGHGLATLATNSAYLARVRAAGAPRAEPRRFPYTTPNACAGEAAIAFGLTGPAFAAGGGAHGGIEALAAAASLVRAGVAERVVVVAVDEGAGAVALLVGKDELEGRIEEVRVELGPEVAPAAAAVPAAMQAHPALVGLSSESPPEAVSAPLPWGGFAKARFFWL